MSERLQHLPKMHILQPKHILLNEKETNEILNKLNISKSQFPKILSSDEGLSKSCKVGDVVKIQRTYNGKPKFYYRVVI